MVSIASISHPSPSKIDTFLIIITNHESHARLPANHHVTAALTVCLSITSRQKEGYNEASLI